MLDVTSNKKPSYNGLTSCTDPQKLQEPRSLREESGNTVASVTNCPTGPRETMFQQRIYPSSEGQPK
jgi:hypothetical protein